MVAEFIMGMIGRPLGTEERTGGGEEGEEEYDGGRGGRKSGNETWRREAGPVVVVDCRDDYSLLSG